MRHWRGPFDRQGYHHGNLKEALIEAAQRFIAERGIGGFTLADAAKLVGVTPAALYRHFRGRDALVAEVAFRGYDELARRLGRALRSEGTALERFTRMGEAYLAFAEQEPGFYTAMFSARPAEGEASCGPFWAKSVQSGGKPVGNANMRTFIRAPASRSIHAWACVLSEWPTNRILGRSGKGSTSNRSGTAHAGRVGVTVRTVAAASRASVMTMPPPPLRLVA